MAVTFWGIEILVKWVLYVAFAVTVDTFFGLFRAIKHRKWNSSTGIDGAIRKIAMMACMMFVVVMDALCGFDITKIFPADIIRYLAAVDITHVGFAEFFGILFVAYECVSILKNMYLCGLPVKWVWAKVYIFLRRYTDELPDTDGVKLE